MDNNNIKYKNINFTFFKNSILTGGFKHKNKKYKIIKIV